MFSVRVSLRMDPALVLLRNTGRYLHPRHPVPVANAVDRIENKSSFSSSPSLFEGQGMARVYLPEVASTLHSAYYVVKLVALAGRAIRLRTLQ